MSGAFFPKLVAALCASAAVMNAMEGNTWTAGIDTFLFMMLAIPSGNTQ